MPDNHWEWDGVAERNRRVFPESLGACDLAGAMKLTAKPHKYGARRKEVDGITFASTAEANAYIQLKALQAAGQISDLELQPRYLLQEAFRDQQGKWHRKIECVWDFRFLECRPEHMPDRTVCVDVKGVSTPIFALKRKLFVAKYPHIRLDVWKTGRR